MMKRKEFCAEVKRKPSIYAVRKDKKEIRVSSDSKPQSTAFTAITYVLHQDVAGIHPMHSGIGKSVYLGLYVVKLKTD